MTRRPKKRTYAIARRKDLWLGVNAQCGVCESRVPLRRVDFYGDPPETPDVLTHEDLHRIYAKMRRWVFQDGAAKCCVCGKSELAMFVADHERFVGLYCRKHLLAELRYVRATLGITDDAPSFLDVRVPVWQLFPVVDAALAAIAASPPQKLYDEATRELRIERLRDRIRSAADLLF